MIGSRLAYVGVAVRGAEQVGEILERDFGLLAQPGRIGSSGRVAPVFPIGETAVALFEVGSDFIGGSLRTGVHHLAVEVGGLLSASLEAAALGIGAVSGESEMGLAGAYRILLNPQDTAGVLTYLSEPLSLPPAPDGPVQRIDHLGVASSDNRLAADIFAHRLGWAVESQQTDAELSQTMETFTSTKYGVKYQSRPAQLVGGVNAAFITIGDCELEFLQELAPSVPGAPDSGASEAGGTRGGPGSTRQDMSVIGRFIQSRGPGLHHLALKVDDINGLLARLEERGHTLIDREGRPGSRLAQIGFIHPASLGGLLVHLVQREELLPW